MQKACELFDSSFCSTNKIHFRDLDVNGEDLDFEADHPDTVSLSKEPSGKEVVEESKGHADASAEIEEGEIKDSSSVESCDDSHRCPFFEKGRCAFGEKCLFLHQSDMGFYNMFDHPRLMSRNVCSQRRLPLKTETILPTVSPDENCPDWDRQLEEAMLRVGFKRKKVPFDELNLTIQTTRVLPTSPTPKNKTSVRSVRYRGEGEPGVSDLVVCKRNKTCSSETAHPPSPKSPRKSKKRYSDSSRSRSLSVGRRFSCKCCRTPSPKPGRRRASYRRPICCYRRKTISTSSSSSSPVSRRRAVRRHVQDAGNDTRQKRRGRSRTSRPHRTKKRLYMGDAKAPVKRGLGKEYQTSKTRRHSKALAPSSPKASEIKCSSHKKNISPTSHSSAKVEKLVASYSSSDRHLSDMSISPYSSDNDFEKESNIRFSSVRCPSDMSISPFSYTPSTNRFSLPVLRADKPTNGETMSQPSVPRKVSKHESSALGKRVKNDVADRNPHVVLPQVPLSESLTPKKRFRREVQGSELSAGPREVPTSVGLALKKRLKGDVPEQKLHAIQQEVPKFEHSTPKTMFKNDVPEPNSSVISQEIPKSMGSTPKKIFENDVSKPKPSTVPQEILKSIGSNPDKKLKNDVSKPKPSTVPQEILKSIDSDPDKLNNDVSQPKPSTVSQEIPKSIDSIPNKKLKNNLSKPKLFTVPPEILKSIDSDRNKKLKNDVSRPKPSTVPQEILKSVGSDPNKKLKNDVSKPKPSTVSQEIPKSIASIPNKKLKNDVSKPKQSTVLQEIPKSIYSNPNKKFKNDLSEPKPSSVPQEIPKPIGSNKKKPKNGVAGLKPPSVPQEMPKSESSAPKEKFNHLLFDLMKFHKKSSSTTVTVNTKAAHPPERKEMLVTKTKVDQKSAAHRGASLSRKALLLKQLQEVTAAIERKKLLAKKKL